MFVGRNFNIPSVKSNERIPDNNQFLIKNSSSIDIADTLNHLSEYLNINNVIDNKTTSSLATFRYTNIMKKETQMTHFSSLKVESKIDLFTLTTIYDDLDPISKRFPIGDGWNGESLDRITLEVEYTSEITEIYIKHMINFLKFFKELFGDKFYILAYILYAEDETRDDSDYQSLHILSLRMNNVEGYDINLDQLKEKIKNFLVNSANICKSGFDGSSFLIPYKFHFHIHYNYSVTLINNVIVDSIEKRRLNDFSYPISNQRKDNIIALSLNKNQTIPEYNITELFRLMYMLDTNETYFKEGLEEDLKNITKYESIIVHDKDLYIVDERITFVYICRIFAQHKRLKFLLEVKDIIPKVKKSIEKPFTIINTRELPKNIDKDIYNKYYNVDRKKRMKALNTLEADVNASITQIGALRYYNGKDSVEGYNIIGELEIPIKDEYFDLIKYSINIKNKKPNPGNLINLIESTRKSLSGSNLAQDKKSNDGEVYYYDWDKDFLEYDYNQIIYMDPYSRYNLEVNGIEIFTGNNNNENKNNEDKKNDTILNIDNNKRLPDIGEPETKRRPKDIEFQQGELNLVNREMESDLEKIGQIIIDANNEEIRENENANTEMNIEQIESEKAKEIMEDLNVLSVKGKVDYSNFDGPAMNIDDLEKEKKIKNENKRFKSFFVSDYEIFLKSMVPELDYELNSEMEIKKINNIQIKERIEGVVDKAANIKFALDNNPSNKNQPVFKDDELNNQVKKDREERKRRANEDLRKKREREAAENNIKQIEKNNRKDKGGNYIMLPMPYLNTFRKCVLNIKSSDLMCFKYCINAWTYLCYGSKIDFYESLRRKDEYSKWLISSPEFRQIDWSCIDFSEGVTFDEIKNFSSINKLKIVIFELEVFGTEGNIKMRNCFGVNIDFLYNKYDNIYLLYYKRHFMLIKDPDNFFQYYIGVSTMNSGRRICQYCDSRIFSTDSALNKHIESECRNILSSIKYELPKKDKISYDLKGCDLKVKIVILCDFETYFENPNINNTANTEYINKHVPYILRCVSISDENYILDEIEIENNINNTFMEYIDKHANALKTQKEIYYNQFRKFENYSNYGIKCSECKINITKGIYYSSDNDFYHERCLDMFMKKTFSMVIMFHNFKNYDLHFIVDEIFKRSEIFVIPKSKEKYTSLQYENNGINVRFGDSRSFLAASLENLSKKLKNYRFIGHNENSHLKGLMGKQSFPYEYITSYEKLLEKELPKERYNWISTLTNKCTSQEDIDKSHEIFKQYNCQNILDYSKLYLKMDVLLLAEIIVDFRENAINTYGIDPLHYFTLPGYAWDMALKTSNVSLELLKDKELIDLVIKGIRGGISSICEYKRLQSNENESILYIDANNLYGWAMSQKMPYGNIEKITNIDINEWKEIIENYNHESDIGYCLEVDLIYPDYLHKEHNALPFLPERLNDKLCLSLKNKKHYFTHIRNLKQAIDNGLVLDKIHKIMKFSQSYWLKEYIDKNTDLRKECTSESAKDFYKLMNNAVFGKSMENVFKRCKYSPVSVFDIKTQEEIRLSRSYIGEELYTNNIIMFKTNDVPVFDKPMYVGFCILDLSKWKMYDTFYNGIKRKWPDVKLAYMDTDSFVIGIPKRYDEINFEGIGDYFDLSVYNGSWKDNTNKGVLGKMKDEFPWGNEDEKKCGPITDFIGLRSKTYALQLENKNVVIKCKGVGKGNITFDDFISQYEWPSIVRMPQVNFKSQKHEVYTIKTNKIVFNNIPDDKRNSNELDNKTYAIGYNY